MNLVLNLFSRLFQTLLGRPFWTFVGMLALACSIWLVGPLLAVGAWRPLESEGARLLVIGILFAVWLLRVLYRTWRAAHLNAQLLTQIRAPGARVKAAPEAAQPHLAALSERFDEAAERLKTARFAAPIDDQPRWMRHPWLQRFSRQYLYQLPWYVFIGAPGSGKTTALVNSGLEFALAEQFGGGVLPLDELPTQLERADMVVSSTASPHAILGEEELAEIMRARGGRPLLILDIAVPRDVESGCGDLEGVTLIDVDGLQRVVRRNLQVREAEARHAERIVEEEIDRFAVWLSTLDVMPTVAALRAHADDIVDGVLAENAERWETEADRQRAEKLARAVMNRLLHEPTVRLKTLGGHGRLQITRELFGLDEGASMDAADENVRPLRRPA